MKTPATVLTLLATMFFVGCGDGGEDKVIQRDAELEAQIEADQEDFSREMEAAAARGSDS